MEEKDLNTEAEIMKNEFDKIVKNTLIFSESMKTVSKELKKAGSNFEKIGK